MGIAVIGQGSKDYTYKEIARIKHPWYSREDITRAESVVIGLSVRPSYEGLTRTESVEITIG